MVRCGSLGAGINPNSKQREKESEIYNTWKEKEKDGEGRVVVGMVGENSNI